MKRYIIILKVLFLTLGSGVKAQTLYDPTLLIKVELGDDINTFVNTSTTINVYASSLEGNSIIRYEWDMNGDDISDITSTTSQINDSFNTYGTCRVRVDVFDDKGNSSYDCMLVTVNQGIGTPSRVPKQNTSPSPQIIRAGDGIVKTYALLISGGRETWFWSQADSMYSVLKNKYQISDNNIYLLHNLGLNPLGQNPNNIIDFSASKQNLQNVFNTLSSIMDADDRLFVWVNAHGAGYGGSNIQENNLKYVLESKAVIRNGGEKYCKEKDFKLRAFYNKGYWSKILGMNQWGVERNGNIFKRTRYVSSFNVTLQNGSHVVDNDVFIEKQIDYALAVDYNNNGKEAFDGVNFDEGDWGQIDEIIDGAIDFGGNVPGDNPSQFVLFDKNNDNTLDIDLHHSLSYITNGHINELQADLTDTNNDGFFENMDINGNGNTDDWVTIDNYFRISDSDIWDYDFANYFTSIPSNNIVVTVESCYSGGFLYELSKKGRIILVSTEKDKLALALDGFTDNLQKSLQYPNLSDTNNDGAISLTEAFRYAMQKTLPQISFYDDNGDGIGHTDLTQDNSDGCWGSFNTITTNLLSNTGLSNETITTDRVVQGNTISATNVVIDNNAKVQMNSPGDIIIGAGSEVKIGATLETNNTPCP